MSGERRKIVAGAGSGIGAAVAAHFHDRGDYVLAVDIDMHVGAGFINSMTAGAPIEL